MSFFNFLTKLVDKISWTIYLCPWLLAVAGRVLRGSKGI